MSVSLMVLMVLMVLIVLMIAGSDFDHTWQWGLSWWPDNCNGEGDGTIYLGGGMEVGCTGGVGWLY